jgi:hypothetical protein
MEIFPLGLFLFAIPLAVLLAHGILFVFALVDILRSRFETENTKILWLLVILLLPILGPILYLIIGKNQKDKF